jgi:hypothetical protein
MGTRVVEVRNGLVRPVLRDAHDAAASSCSVARQRETVLGGALFSCMLGLSLGQSDRPSSARIPHDAGSVS